MVYSVLARKFEWPIPKMTAAVQSDFELLSNKIKSIQEANLNEAHNLHQSLSCFNSNAQRPPTTPSDSSLALINYSPPSLSFPSASNRWYSLNRKIITISDVWREYSVGLSLSTFIDTIITPLFHKTTRRRLFRWINEVGRAREKVIKYATLFVVSPNN
ncbi:hypothetical protein EDC94DRAFT_666852 [Helicostylum pulchrum]|nr:hypothetical protein EDC94DRAFT_666852 [Helicostylum pulchrum]